MFGYSDLSRVLLFKSSILTIQAFCYFSMMTMEKRWVKAKEILKICKGKAIQYVKLNKAFLHPLPRMNSHHNQAQFPFLWSVHFVHLICGSDFVFIVQFSFFKHSVKCLSKWPVFKNWTLTPTAASCHVNSSSRTLTIVKSKSGFISLAGHSNSHTLSTVLFCKLVSSSFSVEYSEIGQVWYINIVTWLRGFQDKSLYLVVFLLYPNLFWELHVKDKGNFKRVGILTRKPRIHVRILIYRKWLINIVAKT